MKTNNTALFCSCNLQKKVNFSSSHSFSYEVTTCYARERRL